MAGQIYPIIVDKVTGEILDGNKRFKADPNWRYEEVEVKSVEQRLAIKYHSIWAREQGDKGKILTELAMETGWRGLAPFAKFFSVGETTISKHLEQKFKDTAQSQRASAARHAAEEKAVEILADSAREAQELAEGLKDKEPELAAKLDEVHQAIARAF